MFYLRRKAFASAIIYFKDVIANYPTTARAPDALLRLVDSYRAIGYKQELQETCEHLRRFYPQATGLARTCPATPDSSATPSPPSTPSAAWPRGGGHCSRAPSPPPTSPTSPSRQHPHP